MTRFEAFKTALEALCVEHGVQLSSACAVEPFDTIVVWDNWPHEGGPLLSQLCDELLHVADPPPTVEYRGVSRGLTQTEQIPSRVTRPDKFGKPSPNNGV